MHSEVFDRLQVILYNGLSKVTALEFFQHYFAKSGHKDLLMTRQPTLTASRPPARHSPLLSPRAQPPPHQRLRSNAAFTDTDYLEPYSLMRIVWDQFPFLVFQPESQPENALENTIFPGRTKCTERPKQVHRAAIHPSLLNASATGIPAFPSNW